MTDWSTSLNWDGPMAQIGLAMMVALLVIVILIGVGQRR
jgi:hypothetical protein